MKIITVGAGKLIYFLCQNLIKHGHEVVIVNRKESECRWFARRLKSLVIHGDGSLPAILEDAGANDADAVLALTPSDADNLVICQVAKHKFGITNTVAMLANPEYEELYPKLGVSRVIPMSRIMSVLIEERTEFEDIIDILSFAQGKVHIAELKLAKNSPAVNKSLSMLDLPRDTLIACVIRTEGVMIPKGDTVLQEGDQILLIGLQDTYREAINALKGFA